LFGTVLLQKAEKFVVAYASMDAPFAKRMTTAAQTHAIVQFKAIRLPELLWHKVVRLDVFGRSA
jgi:hypothetical protein